MNTILIVDDEYLIADILGFALEDEGYQVEKASNGRKALEALKGGREGGHVQLVITDYMMPVMSGVELVRAIRTELELP
ncbi:response regulator, partial [Citrobacter cronae]|uniref:response regulator n=2 Tax=Gammaproteobacteria TaxID=1236 RepID=UPI001247039A